MAKSISDQIKQIEDILRGQAERLGGLNMRHNQYLEENEKLAMQILQLSKKVSKKTHLIDQQNKDKMIIHGKLIKAEREKQLLEIEKQQTKKQIPNLKNHLQKEQQNYENHENDYQKTPEKKYEQEEDSDDTNKKYKNQSEAQQNYADSERGDYQPPVLFEQTNEHNQNQSEDSSEDDEDQKQILQKLRSRVQEQDDD